MKIQYILVALGLMVSFSSCKKDEEKHNPIQQAIDDEKAIIDYLETHYVDDEGTLRTIKNNETPIKNNIKSKAITNNDIDYKLYYLTLKEGVGTNPKAIDSVYISYSGILLDSTSFQKKVSPHWMHLSSSKSGYVTGFKEGTTFFKTGTRVVNPDESFYYKNSGQGYVFIPSGLAYGNRSLGNVPKNSPLIFKFDIQDVKAIEQDDDK